MTKILEMADIRPKYVKYSLDLNPSDSFVPT